MFKQLKEEKLMIPVLMVLVEILRQFILKYNPMAGTFIPETELLVFAVKFWQFLWITSGVWVLMRVVFPSVYKHLIFLYEDFERVDSHEYSNRTQFSLLIFISFLIGFIMLFNGSKGQVYNDAETKLRYRICDTLSKQLYVREATNRNDGTEVKRYLKYVGLPEGNSWCAAYVSYNLGTYKIPSPISARAKDFHKPIYKPNVAKPGDVFTLYYSNLGRIGHVGFIVENTHGYYRTNEGNTGGSGVREGDGVHSYLRNKQAIYSVNNYISLKYVSNEINKNSVTSMLNYSFFGYRNGLQQAFDEKFGKGTNFTYRSKGGFEFVQFQTNLSGYNSYNKSRYEFGSFGCTRSTEFETSYNRYENTKNNSFSRKWQAIRYNSMQGAGAEAKTYEAGNCYISKTRQKQKGSKTRNENKDDNCKGTIQALVVGRIGMDRCNCIANCYHLCSNKIVHCWSA